MKFVCSRSCIIYLMLIFSLFACKKEVTPDAAPTLNETATTFPGTNLRLIYELVSNNNPRGLKVRLRPFTRLN